MKSACFKMIIKKFIFLVIFNFVNELVIKSSDKDI